MIQLWSTVSLRIAFPLAKNKLNDRKQSKEQDCPEPHGPGIKGDTVREEGYMRETFDFVQP